MPARTDSFDLGRLRLRPGEGRRLDLEVDVESLSYGGQRYAVEPRRVVARLDASRMASGGYALRMRFTAVLSGPCMRCLKDASPDVDVDAREIDQAGGGDELSSPYVGEDQVLDLRAWARDAFALALPQQVVCREACPGLCPVCGTDLDEAGPDHAHEREPDPRWAKLSELRFD